MAAGKKTPGFTAALAVLAAVITVLLGWYAYQAAGLSKGGREARAHVDRIAENAADLARRTAEDFFRPEDVDHCETMDSEYRALNGEPLKGADVRRLLNLPDGAGPEAVRRRCIQFAKAVAKMQKLSRHTLHVMVCQDALFRIENDDRFTIRPGKKGRGVIQTIVKTMPKNLQIKQGRSVIIEDWQIFNMGGGCVIIGDSSRTKAAEAESAARKARRGMPKGEFLTGSFKEFKFQQ